MSAKIPEIIDRLSGKIELLCDKYVMVRDERDAARAEACELREQVQTLRTALEQANTEIEYLRISHKIAPTRDDVLRSRVLMTELVKKIDKCIARLRKD